MRVGLGCKGFQPKHIFLYLSKELISVFDSKFRLGSILVTTEPKFICHLDLFLLLKLKYVILVDGNAKRNKD